MECDGAGVGGIGIEWILKHEGVFFIYRRVFNLSASAGQRSLCEKMLVIQDSQQDVLCEVCRL